MALHLRTDTVRILEEADMAQLVELIIADRLGGHAGFDHCDIRIGGRHHSDARAGEADFRGGGHHNHAVRVASLRAFVEHIEHLVGRIGQIVDAISVIPDDAEILRACLHGCHTADDFVRISFSFRIGILRHTEHAFDCRVLHDLFQQLHIRAVLQHRDVDHLDPKIFAHAEMSVVTGHRAGKLHLIELAPRGAARAVRHALGNIVKHHIQA